MHDVHDELAHGISIEGHFEGHELVENAPQAPHVRLAIVAFVVHDLWRHVVWRTDAGGSQFASILKHARDPEIAQLDDTRLGEENVLCLEVTVQDLAIVDMLDGQRHLDEQVQDLFLLEQPTALLLDVLLQVSSISELHHNEQITSAFVFVLFQKALPKQSDVWVIPEV